MVASSFSSPVIFSLNSNDRARSFPAKCPKQAPIRPNHRGTSKQWIERNKFKVMNDVSAAADPSHAQVNWQIVVGALAGVTPFVVAGIEFGKRIVAQRRCELCRGSGLVLRDKSYFRCPGCGGFLPWQSWKRFFSG
ncbi:hypothetical protein Nepgr_016278 [Nepenthes gracilis]|uniref:Viral late gene transcription factor 3 zinc ribbon domain-containing protein n=1 Tax=Nepenthes gracilis TaxID=150966 RepID=A0AAD3SNX5_NEPGR|nr:hypothetical protein Nepgr_016278 [Nepenthes gracilis]